MKTQKQRVLELLQRRTKKGVKCYEFGLLEPKIMCYTARISSLRKDGYTIDCRLSYKDGQKHSLYKLIDKSYQVVTKKTGKTKK